MKEVYEDDLVKLIHSDAFEYMRKLKDESIDVIIADPPYFLSNGGFSNSGGKAVSVNKGEWDKSETLESEKKFYDDFLKESYRVLKKNGTLWVFGTMHNIYILGYLMPINNFKFLNNITWQKSNPAPNLSRRMFTHSTETILWAKKKDGKQIFNYDRMREINDHKQMKDVWTTATINKSEKRFGNHPTQKPLSIINRIIQASTNEEMTILDPFVGSGTTTVAGKINGIKTIGVDNSIEYLKIASQRVEDWKNEKIGKIK
ncbi:DNA-methyltransferase [Companilactobacillus mishanensis]|uniref:DNA-methyltransferase n=1 Tax=Companilactobacillus mishanensis TaxID=2486008 RepID=UPI001297F888|nr:site-specific DNA-methyltransferase [Companilactobacillus mishanensis]MQS89574.1 site-specific DNA-methyltransferase [Companilactobacillus mishanensis]